MDRNLTTARACRAPEARPLRILLSAYACEPDRQDAHSWTETLEIPAEIREAILAKKTIPQWDRVLASAARLRVRVAELGGLQPPGAVEAAPPGPRQENKR